MTTPCRRTGATARWRTAISLEIAKQIWDDAEKFAKYAFNKSHSAAYAILVMRTAYLKAHYPNDYHGGRAVQLHGQRRPAYQLHRQLQRIRAYPFCPPTSTRPTSSSRRWTKACASGLAGVRGVGENGRGGDHRRARGQRPVHQPARLREPSRYAKCYNRKTLEALIKGGRVRLDGLHAQAAHVLRGRDAASGGRLEAPEGPRRAARCPCSTCSRDDPDSGFEEEIPEPDGVEWDKRTKLAYEKEILKIYVSDHPLRPYEGVICVA